MITRNLPDPHRYHFSQTLRFWQPLSNSMYYIRRLAHFFETTSAESKLLQWLMIKYDLWYYIRIHTWRNKHPLTLTNFPSCWGTTSGVMVGATYLLLSAMCAKITSTCLFNSPLCPLTLNVKCGIFKVTTKSVCIMHLIIAWIYFIAHKMEEFKFCCRLLLNWPNITKMNLQVFFPNSNNNHVKEGQI